MWGQNVSCDFGGGGGRFGVSIYESRDPGLPLQNTKSPPPRKSPKITQKSQFGPPRACPENYRKITKKWNFLVIYK